MEVQLTETFKLVPLDDRNWQLWELRKVTNAKTHETRTDWVPCGRYYASVGHACEQVADVLMKRRRTKNAASLREAADEFRAIVRGMSDMTRKVGAYK